MSLSTSIHEAVLYCDLSQLTDRTTVENKVLSAFMSDGDFFATTMHAMYFALLVAEALGAGEPV